VVEQETLYDKIIVISEDYFGPVAARCVQRIISNHIGKKPKQIEPKDMPELITWIKLAAAMVTDEAEIIGEFEQRLKSLAAA
jgi:hypothetical protein